MSILDFSCSEEHDYVWRLLKDFFFFEWRWHISSTSKQKQFWFKIVLLPSYKLSVLWDCTLSRTIQHSFVSINQGCDWTTSVFSWLVWNFCIPNLKLVQRFQKFQAWSFRLENSQEQFPMKLCCFYFRRESVTT